jgi:alpha-mannosidase
VEIYHLEKGIPTQVGQASLVESGPLCAILKVSHPITSTSTVHQTITVTAGSRLIQFETEVEWNENRKILVSLKST